MRGLTGKKVKGVNNLKNKILIGFCFLAFGAVTALIGLIKESEAIGATGMALFIPVMILFFSALLHQESTEK